MSVQEWTFAPVTFRADRETAEKIRDAMQTAVDALVSPTKDNASKLFTLGAEAVATAAQLEREKS